jgi:hypothetical protein
MLSTLVPSAAVTCSHSVTSDFLPTALLSALEVSKASYGIQMYVR